MISVPGRKLAAGLVQPVARGALKLGLTPNMVTVFGAVVAVAVSVILIPQGYLITAAIITAVFVAFDLIDGTMATLSGGGTAFGATLDATCDRITDGAFFAAVCWYLIYQASAPPSTVAAALIVLVASQVISYAKARGEASGLRIEGGLVERAERLIIGLLAIALEGAGVPYALAICLWLLAIGSVITVIQRLAMAWRQSTTTHQAT